MRPGARHDRKSARWSSSSSSWRASGTRCPWIASSSWRRWCTCARVPGAPPVVTGLVNHRGSAIALVPLRRVFGLEGETGAARTDGRLPIDDHLVIAEGRTRR